MRQCLRDQFQRLTQSSVRCWMREKGCGNRTMFQFDTEANIGNKALRNALGTAVAEYYISICEPDLIRQIIRRQFQYQHPDDRRRIEQYTYELLMDSDDDAPSGQTRKVRMAQHVAQYLAQHQVLAADGFFHFRLKRYRNGLIHLVEHAVDEYLLDQEYREFIDLLRYFVSVQPPKYSLVHVLHTDERRFQLLDGEGRPLRMKELDGAVKELVEPPFSHEDLIVSTLLTVAPEQVVLHTRNREENVVQTLEQVFETRISLCDGCPECQPHRFHREERIPPKG
ncbi:MAG: putative sporulation protein YtxC [Firmicutes bacterium]|nr:putative sporulation protein YtxC [Melghirimyces thermohalophilus]MDA8353841.1 putative sporulation protein YtxC [Bacillota bacterium]